MARSSGSRGSTSPLRSCALAVAEAAIRLAGDYHLPALTLLYPAPPILALAIVGPVAKALDLYRAARTARSGRSS